MNRTGHKVAIITGGSQGIGASLVAAYRQQGWGVVANARTIKPARDSDVLTVDGDIAEPATTDRIISGALERFGRIDTLVNNAGVFISKPFTDYTAEDYAFVVGVNLTGFFQLTQRAIAEMLKGGGGHVVNITTTLVDYASSGAPSALGTQPGLQQSIVLCTATVNARSCLSEKLAGGLYCWHRIAPAILAARRWRSAEALPGRRHLNRRANC